jgi:predicted unusual protein kinase regulating ubiquinone biosynthesis (AarF/ABC1/UbiB family)
MQRIGAVAPGAEPEVAAAVRSMFDEIRRDAAGPLALSGSRVLALKDEAKRLVLQTAGLQLPGDLLLYAKTVSYLFGLGAELAPQVDLMRLLVPYLLRFLAEREGVSESGARAAVPAPG